MPLWPNVSLNAPTDYERHDAFSIIDAKMPRSDRDSPGAGTASNQEALTMHHHDTPAFRARFWSKVDRSGECWLWKGHVNPVSGYGEYTFWHPAKKAKVTVAAHRIAYWLTYGPIATGIHIRHITCDNPPCCRPDHLAGGTRRQNMADMLKKQRDVWNTKPERMRRGERSPNAKLSQAQVEEIRRRFSAGGVMKVELAREYGVTDVLIGKIVRGESWRHVSQAAESGV